MPASRRPNRRRRADRRCGWRWSRQLSAWRWRWPDSQGRDGRRRRRCRHPCSSSSLAHRQGTRSATSAGRVSRRPQGRVPRVQRRPTGAGDCGCDHSIRRRSAGLKARTACRARRFGHPTASRWRSLRIAPGNASAPRVARPSPSCRISCPTWVRAGAATTAAAGTSEPRIAVACAGLRRRAPAGDDARHRAGEFTPVAADSSGTAGIFSSRRGATAPKPSVSKSDRSIRERRAHVVERGVAGRVRGTGVAAVHDAGRGRDGAALRCIHINTQRHRAAGRRARALQRSEFRR